MAPLSFGSSARRLAARRSDRHARLIRTVIIGAAMLAMANPAQADQSVMVADNGEVRCEVSARDLTRISLKDDQFAAVSKVETGNPFEDFAIVHEPTRGDLYLSVPDGFARPAVSFFGTTLKGFVYRFNCRVGGDEARQVFIANADLEFPQPAPAPLPSAAPLPDQALGLIRAMFEQRGVEGFRIDDQARVPVHVGALKVQLISQYVSPTLAGKLLRIENMGSEPVTLAEELVAADGAIALSIANPQLQPGQASAAYVVVPAGGF